MPASMVSWVITAHRWVPGACWPGILAESASPRFSESISTNKVERNWANISFLSSHIHMHTSQIHAHTLTCVHILRCIHMNMYTHTLTCIHMNMHTYTHTQNPVMVACTCNSSTKETGGTGGTGGFQQVCGFAAKLGYRSESLPLQR